MTKQVYANQTDILKVRQTLENLNNPSSWPVILGLPETHGLTPKKGKYWFERVPTNKFVSYFISQNSGYHDKFTSVERIFRFVKAQLREEVKANLETEVSSNDIGSIVERIKQNKIA